MANTMEEFEALLNESFEIDTLIWAAQLRSCQVHKLTCALCATLAR